MIPGGHECRKGGAKDHHWMSVGCTEYDLLERGKLCTNGKDNAEKLAGLCQSVVRGFLSRRMHRN